MSVSDSSAKPALPDDIIGPLAVFISPATETLYRHDQMRGDVALASACLLLGSVGCLLFAPSDYFFFGASALFWGLLTLRCACVVGSLAVFVAMRRGLTPRAFDRTLLVWCVLMAVQNACIVATRPPSYTGHAVLSVLMVLMAFCVVPLPLKLQFVPALITIAAGLAMCFRTEAGMGWIACVAVVAGFLGAIGFGAITSWQTHRRKRELFATARRERHLRADLEHTLAEVRTLRGLHCICAYCKKMKDPAGRWQQIEVYVGDRTHAQFSHGMCPDCFEDAMRKLPGSEKDR
ncbi:MAG: hypothetical protein IT429_13985 [Gemmataceae bacterium]|nr:hypothetical protein [Gemmataceae bacterium]